MQVFTGAVIDTKNFNIEASNGVIHVIEQVVGSLEDTDLLGKAVNNSDLSKVVEGVVAAKLEGVLNGKLGKQFYESDRVRTYCSFAVYF